MNLLKNWQSIIVVVFIAFFSFSCNSSNANSESKPSNKEVQTTGVAGMLEKAKNEGKAAFVVVKSNTSADTDKALAAAEKANTLYDNAVVIELNRDDESNAAILNEWRLTNAPLPLILVISTSGTPAGGLLLSQATPELIASLVPSPNLEKLHEAIGNKQPAIVAFTKTSFGDRNEVIEECKEAVNMLDNAVFISVDIDDDAEAGFLKQVNINPDATNASVTLVINSHGQVAGTSTTIPDAEKLVAAATAPPRMGCGIGPAGCGR